MTDEYAAINPFQLVPAIDDDGFKLNERYANVDCKIYVTSII